MKYLLDASALLPPAVKSGKRLIVEVFRKNLIIITDLEIYETYNSLWKLVTLFKSMSLEDATIVATAIKELVMKGAIRLASVTELDPSRIFRIAYKERLTFHDASYIVIAETMGATLVTEDKKLWKVANKFVEATSYTNFETMLA